jgi:hypothetical protein
MSRNNTYQEDEDFEFFDSMEGDEWDADEIPSNAGRNDEEYDYTDDGVIEDEPLEDDFEDTYEGDIDENVEFDDNTLSDMDFSQFNGDNFKQAFSQIKGAVETNKARKKSMSRGKVKRQRPQKNIKRDIGVKRKAVIEGPSKKKLSKVIIPRGRKVIVEGVSKFILSKNEGDDSVRNIGYWKGKKLKNITLTFNNNSAVDFDIEVFNPSFPLDYLYSTSQNVNNKVKVAGGAVSYTDVLYNVLANPTFIPNAKFVLSGPSITQQTSQPLVFKNKNVDGDVKIHPINLSLQLDTDQFTTDVVNFDLGAAINRPYIPDGMDVIGYKVLAGMTVTMAFFYKQVSLKRVLLKEAREDKKLL